ncbi:MAG: hydrogenase maturation protease [Nitrospirae bacterium]|nr:hydrogenase maturation protease [Nitrospirota bacterium]
MDKTCLIIGLGNVLLGDEGAGVYVAEAINTRYVLSEGTKTIDGGTLGLDLLPIIEGYEEAIVIDAVNFGREPGYVEVFDGGDSGLDYVPRFSSHHEGVGDIVTALTLLGVYSEAKPPRLFIIGIQPGDIGEGIGLSDEAKAGVERAIGIVRQRLMLFPTGTT